MMISIRLQGQRAQVWLCLFDVLGHRPATRSVRLLMFQLRTEEFVVLALVSYRTPGVLRTVDLDRSQ